MNDPLKSLDHAHGQARGGLDYRPRTTSAALFCGARELVITHNGRTYRLRLTRNGKLILTA